MTPINRRGRFLIPSLLAAGIGTQEGAQAALTYAATTGTDDPNAGKQFQIFKQDHEVTLAQHRSHSSHRSHRSHSSHRSSTGGGYTPLYTPPPTPAPPPPRKPVPDPVPYSATPPGDQRATPPSDQPAASSVLPVLTGRTHRFATIVRRVQIALLGQGLFDGPITGTVGPVTRGALRRFQQVRGLAVTGTITPETLDALRVSSE